VARLTHFWGVVPESAVYPALARWATLIWTVPLFCALALGLCERSVWRGRESQHRLRSLVFRSWHAFYWTDLRMRAPIVPAIALVAAAARVPGAASPEQPEPGGLPR